MVLEWFTRYKYVKRTWCQNMGYLGKRKRYCRSPLWVPMEALANNIQNVKFGYTQSDEISLLLTDWNKLTTDQWFGGNIQKIVSVSAAIATAYFNHYFSVAMNLVTTEIQNIAVFDSRVFNIPKEEVTNYFVWRQQDTTRNSINMLGQYHFSHKELQHKNVSQVQDMLMLEKQLFLCDAY